jgi:hypothetical protein
MSELRKAAQALIDRWDAPLWKSNVRIHEYITSLRKELKAPESNEEPIAWRIHDGEGKWEYVTFEENETYRNDFIAHNGEKYASWVEPLYAAPCVNRWTK